LYKNKKIVGIILARSKSKRLPNKNELNLNGKPLFYWTLKAAKKSKYLDKIIVSTDSKKIISYIKEESYTQIIIRPKNLRGDNVTSGKVILDIISKKKLLNNIIVVLQPTSPLRKSNDIDNALKKMIDKKENFIVSACFKKKIGKNMIEVKKGYFKKIKKGLSGYALNGAIYAAEVAHFKKSKTFLTKKTMIFRMPISRSIDIDTIEDFNLAKSLFKKK
jgi:CMP-N-acetylneuraminic acid synthetase